MGVKNAYEIIWNKIYNDDWWSNKVGNKCKVLLQLRFSHVLRFCPPTFQLAMVKLFYNGFMIFLFLGFG